MTIDKEIEKGTTEEEYEEDPKVYEVGFHIVPTTAEDDVASVVNTVRDTIENLSGVIISEGTPKMTQLAYSMDHIVANKKSIFDKGDFGWVKFQVVPENVLKIKEDLEKNDSVFRFLIISTVKEDTISKKTMVKFKKTAPAPKQEIKKTDKKEEIKEEEVDKAIEDLVVE
ncbi:MAG TPA: hypothetical protein ENI66_02015 [Candidatus Yonathbacteria bacterium]|nr:hypothetical protein [Candidatus Yonathbacteria bacterium]